MTQSFTVILHKNVLLLYKREIGPEIPYWLTYASYCKLQFMQLRKEGLMKNSGIAIVCRGQGFETRQARIISGFFFRTG